MYVKPLRDHILVRPDRLNTHSSTVIVTSNRERIETSREQLGRTGTVVATGSCRMRYEDRNGKRSQKYRSEPPGLAVGDRIMYGEWDYPSIPSVSGRLLVLSEADVIGIIE